jgi:preprotein translocase subunit YajC
MITFLTGAETAAGPASFIPTIGMVVVFFLVFYFFAIRPQKKQEKQVNEMRNQLMVGDEITTIGGIIGKIISIKEETVMIETGHDRTKIRILKSAVRNVDVHAADAVLPNASSEDKKESK